MTGPAQIGATHPGWRAWRTRDGHLAARKGGSPPGVQAGGANLAELTAAIAAARAAGPASGTAARPCRRANRRCWPCWRLRPGR